MDSQAKLTVDFRPTKRIKKRRELDALVSTKQRSLGRSGTSSSAGRHELLRNESETSAMEEFDVPAKTLLQKRGRSCTWSTCISFGCGVLLAAFIVSVCGLVWMYVQLRKDVDELQAKLAKVDDMSSNITSRLHGLTFAQGSFRHQLQQFDNSLNNLRANISVIMKAFEGSLKMFGRDVAQWRVMNSVPSSPNDPISIVEKKKRPSSDRLSEEEADDEALLEQLPLKKLSWMEKKLFLLNMTFSQQLEEMRTHSALVDVSISAIHNYTTLLDKRMSFLDVPPVSTKNAASDELYHLVNQTLQSQIEMLNTTIAVISDKLDAVVSSSEKLRNSTDSNFRTLSLTTHELSARLKLIEVTVHMMLSDSVTSEATPGGKVDPGPTQSSAIKPVPGSSSSTTESVVNHMKVRRSAAVLESLPRS